jgi:hypothetical protein
MLWNSSFILSAMNRDRGFKLLDCSACGKPTRVGAEATRVLCDTCAAAGRDFPRARQLDLFDSREVEKQSEPK